MIKEPFLMVITFGLIEMIQKIPKINEKMINFLGVDQIK